MVDRGWGMACRFNIFIPYARKHRAFTLVELSVVLVIIGLLVAGVLAAQDMIKAARIKGVIKDVEKYTSAVLTFYDKYGHLPGDLPNATDFWSSCTDDGANTCNGNGNGIIEHANGEVLRAWQHLALSGIIPGEYSGTGTLALGYYQTEGGVNVPESSVENGVFYLWSPSVWGSVSALYGRVALCLIGDRSIMCAGNQATGNNYYKLSAVDAHSLDKKIDDGSARTGKMLADSCHIKNPHRGFDDVVIYKSTDSDYEYDLSNDSISCGLMFLIK